MRTLTVKNSGDFVDKFPPGWHALTILKAKYGEFNDSKYIDVWFKEYADIEKLSMRVWAKTGESGEEFAIGRLFRFANAGIKNISKSDDGEAIITIDDNASELIDKKINVFFYKKEGSKYTEVLPQPAPTEFKNDLEEFTTSKIDYWKQKAEDYYTNYVAKKNSTSSNGFVEETKSVNTESNTEMPW